MKESILDGKRILAVDDEADVLDLLEEEVLQACPNCTIDKARTFEEASQIIKNSETVAAGFSLRF